MVMADCPFTKVAVMQLFYELKQKFSTIPDQVVSDLIVQTAYNRIECEKKLREALKRSELHSYPVNIIGKMTEGKERPKTLSISGHEPNAALHLLSSKSSLPNVEEVSQMAVTRNNAAIGCPCRKQTSRPNEEQQQLDSIGYHKTVFSDSKPDSPSDLCKSVQNIEITNNQSEVFVSDLKLCVQNDTSGCERTSLQVKYTKSPTASSSQSAPTTPLSDRNLIDCDLNGDPETRRHRSSLVFERSPSAFLRIPAEPKRPSTSVTLTLRPPSTEGHSSPVSIATNGSQLRYMTSNYNPRDGYQNQLEIKIGEDGNPTLTACRLKSPSIIPTEQTNCNTSTPVDEITDLLPALDKALSPTLELRLREQRERKERLKAELNRNKQRLNQINQEIRVLGRDLERRKRTPHQSEKVLRLRHEVQQLRAECHRMVTEMETREVPSIGFLPTGGNSDPGHWICRMCTFINHPMLPKCEQCEMARVDFNNPLANILRPSTLQTQLSATHP